MEEERRKNSERRESVKASCETVCNTVTQLEGKIDKNLAVLDLRVRRVEEGVSNFRDFQVEARQFFTESKTREDQRDKDLKLYNEEVANNLKYHDKISSSHSRKVNFRLTIFGLILTFLALVVACAEVYHSYKTGDLKIPKIFHSQKTQQEYTLDKKELPFQAGHLKEYRPWQTNQ